MKKYRHIIYFLTITIALHLIFRFYDLPGKNTTLLILPFLFGFYHLILSIIKVFKQCYWESLISIIKLFLFILISIKILYDYYNVFLASIALIFISFLLYKKKWIQSSKYTILSLVLINTFLLFVPDSFLLNYFNQNMIKWKTVSFDDFKGSPTNHDSIHGAVIYSEFNTKVNRFYNYPPAIVSAIMRPDSSWFRPELKENKEVLQHEQFHFNIAEYYSRLLLDSLKKCWTCNYDQKSSIIDHFGLLKNKMQNTYDTLYFNRDTIKLLNLSMVINSYLNVPLIKFQFSNNREAKVFNQKIIYLFTVRANICKIFNNEALKLFQDLDTNPDLAIDFEHIQTLLINSIDISKKSVAKLDSIREIDNVINLKKYYKNYIITSLQILTDFERYLFALKENRKSKKVKSLRNQIFNNGNHLKEAQYELNNAQELFHKKYDF